MIVDGHLRTPHNLKITPMPHLLPVGYQADASSPLVIGGTYTPQDVRSNKLTLYLLGPLESFEVPQVIPLPHAHMPKSVEDLHGLL